MNESRVLNLFVCLILGLGVLALLLMGCQPSSPTVDDEIIFQITRDYRATHMITATAPLGLEDGFRQDAGYHIVFPNTGLPQLVFVYTEYCGTCWAMRPYIAALEAAFWKRIQVVYLNRAVVQHNYEAFLYLDIRDEPAFYLLSPTGELLHAWQGAPPIETLQQALEDALR